MNQINLLLGVLFALILAYVGVSLFQLEDVANYIRPFILPLALVYYIKGGFKRFTYFFYFLLLYAIGDLLGLIYNYPDISITLDTILYFTCNLLYIASYLCLIVHILKTMPIQKVFGKYTIHLIILLILDVYCVYLVTDVAIQSGNLITIYDNILEFVYNIVIMALLTVTLINYLYRDAPKSMNLLIGALCVVFSEVIQVAYFYVSEVFLLGIAYIVLIILAFVFFFIQARMEYSSISRKLEEEPAATINEAQI